MEQTIERAREIALEASLLPTWYDIDDFAMLERLRREVTGRNGVTGSNRALPAPHTRRFIEEHWAHDSE